MEIHMATSCTVIATNCSIQKRPFIVPQRFNQSTIAGLSNVFKPILRALPQIPLQIDASKTMTNLTTKFLDAIVDSVFEYVDQPLLPSQSNFAPVEEIGEAVAITNIHGEISKDFPEGVYIRNGPNPLFGGKKSTKSLLGRTSSVWVEGEGMLHALYFKNQSDGSSIVVYNNRHVETATYKLEKQSNKPLFLPALRGDSPAILSSLLLNSLRFGKNNRDYSNTNVIEHAGKLYSVADNHVPQEIDIFTLSTLKDWDVGGAIAWNRPFASHPKKVPGTGELVIFGVDATKPFLEVGIVSANGMELVHKMDIKLDRCSYCHEIGVTIRYIAILDFPLIIDLNRLLRGGPLIKYDNEKYARIGMMPRYGDADSIQWFEVEPNSTFHVINSFEDGDEVVLWGCRALDAIIPGPENGLNEKWFSRCYEWRLNMKTGEVREKHITGPEQFMDFPVINPSFTGIKNRYGYTQVVDPIASSAADIVKYGALAKLYFGEPCSKLPVDNTQAEEPIMVEYHMFERNVFCTGSTFVPKEGGLDEDDGWIITFVHNEDTGISQVHIIDTKKFSGEAVAKITMPCRVPYGFHGAFMPISF